MRIKLPDKVNTIIHTLQSHGYEAYAVGGCVRDSILGRRPEDWDITTSAMPEETKALFSHTFDTGIAHGTITVLLGREGFEVTTYRIDGKYEDSRHPTEVIFVRNLKEDLLRRDFTINAMAYNEDDGLVDIFGGLEDIEQGIIRCVGDADARFSEDALRILRGVRFAAQLGFQIEGKTREGMRQLAPTLAKISAERIQVELVKLAVSPHPEKLRTAWETGITGIIMPEFDECMETEQRNPHHRYSVGEHILKSMQEIRPEKTLRLAMLFHDMGKPKTLTVSSEGVYHFHGHQEVSGEIARGILRRLKFDNYTIQTVTRLVRYHDCDILPGQKYVRRAVRKAGEDIFPLLIEVKYADMKAQSDYMREEKEERLKLVQAAYERILTEGHCLKNLAVTGKDLIDEAAMEPGPALGEMLGKLLDIVIENPELNRKETLLAIVTEESGNKDG